jgi:hypothetical protein
MHPLARRIALLVSVFSLLAGIFLLGYNLRLISEDARRVALQLWPILLIAAGIMLVADSTRKRAFGLTTRARTEQHVLPVNGTASELTCHVQFSYGRLVIGPATGAPRLVTEQVGRGGSPTISEQRLGERREISITIGQPLFPAHFQLHNTWRLELPRGIPLHLVLQLHEADLKTDLRPLDVESLELRAESGDHEVILCRPRKKLTAQIYASGSSLSLILPARVFAWVRLLNPFCRIDYPQGDLERKEDGSLVSANPSESRGSVEIEVDGPLRTLRLDIEDTAEA